MNQHERSPLLPSFTTDFLEQHHQKSLKFIGGLLTIVCSIGFSGNSYLVKRWEIDAIDFLLVRSVVSLITFGLWTYFKKEKYFLNRADYNSNFDYYFDVFVLLLQACCSEAVITLSVFAVREISISDALTFIWSQPLFVMLLSAALYAEHIRLYKLSVMIILVTGIVFVVQPESLFNNVKSSPDDGTGDFAIGVGLSLGCALCSAVNTICTNYLKRTNIAKSSLMVNGSLTGIGFAFIAFSLDHKSLIFHDFTQVNWATLVLPTLVAIGSLLVFYQSCQMTPPTFFSLLRTTEILFGFVWDALSGSKSLDAMTICGGALVILSSVLIGLEMKIVPRIPSQRIRNLLSKIHTEESSEYIPI